MVSKRFLGRWTPWGCACHGESNQWRDAVSHDWPLGQKKLVDLSGKKWPQHQLLHPSTLFLWDWSKNISSVCSTSACYSKGKAVKPAKPRLVQPSQEKQPHLREKSMFPGFPGHFPMVSMVAWHVGELWLVANWYSIFINMGVSENQKNKKKRLSNKGTL